MTSLSATADRLAAEAALGQLRHDLGVWRRAVAHWTAELETARLVYDETASEVARLRQLAMPEMVSRAGYSPTGERMFISDASDSTTGPAERRWRNAEASLTSVLASVNRTDALRNYATTMLARHEAELSGAERLGGNT